ncbi:putative protein C17D11.03c [Ceratocystis platani]|uniref:Carboxymuconolactone decarboxylase-like domain-containing protein n=1 Tax=Ceratocystis fimbriata f. sp. platani TaxID=88771 RepID=A0A0F8CXN3_CERFI|nr:putative protein C17D11.03c [Ceratocystis platani]
MASALAPIITPTLLSAIRTQPNLPSNTWYFITATALSILNRPDEISSVYKYALSHGPGSFDNSPGDNEKLGMTRRIREALVKSAAIGGLPKTINALLELKQATPPAFLDEPLATSPTQRRNEIFGTPSAEVLQRGQTYFDMVYGKITQRVMGNMDRSGTEDLGLTARLMYGYILSNTNVLTPAETSYVILAALIPQDVNPQLKGHLKGAINGGATVENVRAVREVVIKICEASGMKKLSDAASGGWGWRQDVANL